MASYTFEVAMDFAMMPRSGYYTIRVVDRKVVEAYRPNGEPAPDLALTVDEIWDEILAAHASGDLNHVSFDGRGVPIEADIGDWALDAGHRYSVRNFVPSR